MQHPFEGEGHFRRSSKNPARLSSGWDPEDCQRQGRDEGRKKMNFRFLVPGKPKEDFLVSGIREYSKRLSKFGKVQIEYLPEERLSPKPSQEEISRALAKEGERALLRIKDQEYLFLLDI